MAASGGWRARLAPGLLALCGGLGALVIWLAWSRPFALADTVLLIRVNFARIVAYDGAALLRACAAWLALWLAYGGGWWALRQIKPGAGGRRWVPLALILAGWAIMAGGWALAYPGGSLDVFDYNFRGHMVAHLNASPLTTTPAAVIPDAAYPFLSWRDVVDSYGPVWEYLSGIVHASVPHGADLRDHLAGAVLAYRGLALLCALVGGLLLRRWVDEARPGSGDEALLLWLWNPLALFETANGAHNDVVMLLLLLIAARWIWRGAGIGGLLLVGIAAQIKITALLVVPAFGLWFWQRYGLRRTLRAAAIALPLSGLLSWALFAPLGGWASLPGWWADRSAYISGSLARWWAMSQSGTPAISPQLARQAGAGASLAFGAVLLALLARAAGRRMELAELTWAVLLAYLLVGAFWFQPWYVVWLLPWALLSQQWRVIGVTLAYSFLASWLIYAQSWFQPWLAAHLGPNGYEWLAPLPGLAAALLLAGLLLAVSGGERHPAALVR